MILDRCRIEQVGAGQICDLLVETDTPDGEKVRFPWITPVLGSGTSGGVNAIDLIEGSVRTIVATLPRAEQRELAAGFASSLVAQRLALPSWSIEVPPHADGDGPSEVAALLHATAWVTKAFHRLRAQGMPVLGGPHEGPAILEAGRSGGAEVRASFIEPAIEAIGEATAVCNRTLAAFDGDDADRELLVSAVRLLEQTEADLRPAAAAIDPVRVRSLTEYTWRRVSEPIAPGWSDLLWDLFMATTAWPPKDGLRGPRPLAAMLDRAGEGVARRFAESAGDEHLYRAVAGVLQAQSRLYDSLTGSAKVPPPSAFVTTFGLELERALIEAGQPFVMVLPLNVTIGKARALVWVGCRIDPGAAASLELIRTPAPDAWFLLHEGPGFHQRPQWRSPAVVRLTGSPLVTLPPVVELQSLIDEIAELMVSTRELKSKKGARQLDKVRFSHALLLDEYVALDQSAGLLHPSRRLHDASESDVSRRLPPELTASDEEKRVYRFWMMLGVQMGDPAVRHSIAVQLGKAGARQPGKAGRSPLRNGFAVQSRVSGEAEDLLRQIGLDVVQGEAGLFVQDLEHYRRHVLTVVEDREARRVATGQQPARLGGFGRFPVGDEPCGVREAP
jgi:hypothetical protein